MKHIQLWERSDGENLQIVGIANPEIIDQYYLQVNPEYDFLEREMIQWIEDHYRGIEETKPDILNVTIRKSSFST